MFNCSIAELGVILAVACLVFKPEELPALAQKIGLYLSHAREKLTELKTLWLKPHE